MVNAIDNIMSKINFQTMMPKNTGNGQQMTPFNSGADFGYTPAPAWNISPTADKTGLNPNNSGGLNKNSWGASLQASLQDFSPKNMFKNILGGAAAGNPWSSDDSQEMASKPNLGLINSSYNPQKNQSTPYAPKMYQPQASVVQKPIAFQSSEVPGVNNVLKNIDTDKLVSRVLSMEVPNVQEQSGTFWDKAKDFATSPTGGSLLTGLLTGGLVAATGGNGLEALSYGAQSGGTATKTWREQRNKELKRKQEDDYLQARIAEQQADREARQLETDKRIANDWGLAEYKHNLETKLLGAQNQGIYDKTLLQEQAKNFAEVQKGTQAMEVMRPSVETALKRAKDALANENGLGPIGGRLTALGMNASKNAGDNYADIESANAQMNALLRQRLQATGLTGSELNSAMEANAYRYTISPTDSEKVALRKINNFEGDYLGSASSQSGVGDTVRVQTPNGKIVLVPQNRVNEAIDNGGRVL